MFTGLIEETGTVVRIIKGNESAVIEIKAETIMADLKQGDSVSVNGVCLTAVTVKKNSFTADVMHETFNRSTFSSLYEGCLVNLERAMTLTGRFGGHIVTGHIDGTGTIRNIYKDGNAIWYEIECAPKILRLIILKGSVAIDGISLTVANVTNSSFKVSVIPHTERETTLSFKKKGDRVNLENDCIGKYVEKLLKNTEQKNREEGITEEFLMENGF